jgi:hypothetical protein
MLHTDVQPRNPLKRIPPTPKAKLIELILGFGGLGLAVIFLVAWWIARAPSPAAPLDNANHLPPVNASAGNANISFEQTARNLAASNSPEAFQTLLDSLKQGEPPAQRDMVLTALKDASPSVVPVLMLGLNNMDAGVRTGASQVLGLRREVQAITALTDATRDPVASVRREAINSLVALDAWQVLPRLEQLAVMDPNYDVRQSAMAAKQSFKQAMAQAIGVLAPALRDISVTTGDAPRIYAITTNNLYARHGTVWTLVSRLPDAPLAIATGADPNLIYLTTVSTGLYRSLDGGETWEYVTFGLQTATNLTITAIVVDPHDSRRVYIALASPGAGVGIKDPTGLSESKDGGATWWALENSPMDVIITRLVMDPQWQGYLFGMTTDTPWRYALPTLGIVVVDPANRGVIPQ